MSWLLRQSRKSSEGTKEFGGGSGGPADAVANRQLATGAGTNRGSQVPRGGHRREANAERYHPDGALAGPWPQVGQLQPQGRAVRHDIQRQIRDDSSGQNRSRLGGRLDDVPRGPVDGALG